jgi:hypothetical protein
MSMELPSVETLLNVAVVLILVAVGWAILRVILRLTARLFRIGCLVLLVVVGLVWLAGTLN